MRWATPLTLLGLLLGCQNTQVATQQSSETEQEPATQTSTHRFRIDYTVTVDPLPASSTRL